MVFKLFIAGLVAVLGSGIAPRVSQSAELSGEPLAILEGTDFAGGANGRYGTRFLGKTNVNFVYAAPSGSLSRMQSTWKLEAIPTAPQFLHLTASDDDVAGECGVSIQLNGEILFTGKNPFPRGAWETQKFAIAPEILRVGENTLTVINTELQGNAGGPPWFMLTEAVIAPEQFNRPLQPVHLEKTPKSTPRQIGLAKIDITPKRPVLLSGYAGRQHQLTSKSNQKLWARALAIGSDAEAPTLLITVDNCAVPAKVRDSVAEELQSRFQLQPARLTISSTHTHSAPMLSGVLENLLLREFTPEERDSVDGYTQELVELLIQVGAEALKNREPAYLHFGHGETTFARNRRRGPVTDHDTPVLVVAGEDGKPRGVITNYACHCVSAGSGLEMSGDWATCAADEIETLFPGAIGMVVIGCGADQNPTDMSGFAASQRQGKMLADEVRRVTGTSLPTIDGPLTVQFKNIELPFAAVPTEDELKTRSEKSGVAGYQARKALAQLKRGEALPASLTYPVQTWVFGHELAMVFLGDEVVVDYAIELKKTIDSGRLWVSAYSNDVTCYIPSDRILQEGGYEAADAMDWYGLPSALARGTDQRILSEVTRQLGSPVEWKHNVSRTGGTRPLSPRESIAAMSVRDGFRVEIVAAEPLVIDPVAIDFGPDGKLWVVEMRDYPEGIPGDVFSSGDVKFLEDTDKDGQFDKATAFLEGVAFPTGVTAWRNGVLICAAPDVIYAEDTDGDGRADVRQVILGGFETHNYQARVNSLSLGLDNWIHGAAGIFGGMITAEGKKPVDARNRDFRFQPDSKVVEAISGRTQQGRARDDWGNWFGCSNSELLLSYPTTEHYYARNPRVHLPNSVVNIARNQQLYPTGKLVQFTYSGPSGLPTSSCGLSIYRDNLLGEEFSNNAFICEPVNQLVHRRTIHSNSSLLTATRAEGEEHSEFLSSTDNWFRPVQTRTGPDGALYVVDMYRYVIEHPKFISKDVKAGLDLRAGDTRGRIYRILPVDTPAKEAPVVRTMTIPQLVELLDNSNGTVRDQAHLELLWRNATDSAAALDQLALNGTTPQGRLHALCVLDGLNLLSKKLLVQALQNEQHPGVQRTAIRLSEKFMKESPEIVKELARFTNSSDAQVRMQLAYSSGATSSPLNVPLLAELVAASKEDIYLQSAALSSLTPENTQAVLSEMLKSKRERELTYPVLLLAADIADPAASQIALDPEFLPENQAFQVPHLNLLAAIRQAYARRKIQLAAEPAKHWEAAFQRCHDLAIAPDVAVDRRVAAIALVPRMSDSAEAIRILEECLLPQQPIPVQESAVRALVSIKAKEAQESLFSGLRRLAPKVQAIVLDEICSKQTLTLELMRQLEEGTLPRTMIDLTRKQQLASSPNIEIRERAQRLFAKPSSEEISARLAAVRAADLSGGDSNLGKQLFVKHCASCHLSGGIGHDVGPELDSLTDRSKEYLTTAILDPNAAIDRRYASYTAILLDGRINTGILASEGENSITLKEKEGLKREILRADLEELLDTGKSMMPDGLGREIDHEGLRHLLAFLKATRLESKTEVSKRTVNTQFESVKGIDQLISGAKIGTEDEYRVIPDVFRLAIAAGKRNDVAELLAILELTLPNDGEPLRDWEAVVIGGGIVNGISQANVWPRARIESILKEEPSLSLRWSRTLKLALEMAHNKAVHAGTRYDALRIVALLPFSESRDTLEFYLKPDAEIDLMQGAVSGLADIPREEAAMLLAETLHRLPDRLRPFAIDGLVRVDGERIYLLDAVSNNNQAADKVPAEVRFSLLTHQLASVREKAGHFWGKADSPK